MALKARWMEGGLGGPIRSLAASVAASHEPGENTVLDAPTKTTVRGNANIVKLHATG